jgi:hypothetical protein
MVGLSYDYAFFQKKYFQFGASLSGGINENANDKDKNDRAVYGLQYGIRSSFGKQLLYADIEIKPSTYFHKNLTYTNINAWAGLRMVFRQGIYFSLAFTPVLYTSYNSIHKKYFNTMAGFRVGINF